MIFETKNKPFTKFRFIHKFVVCMHQRTNMFRLLLIQTVLRICDALRGLVPFVQFKKREKHP